VTNEFGSSGPWQRNTNCAHFHIGTSFSARHVLIKLLPCSHWFLIGELCDVARMRSKADRPSYYSCESRVCEYFVCAFSFSHFVFLGFQQLQLLVIVFVPGEKVGPSAAPSCGLAGGVTPGNR
jgi:hypothetical protein